MSDLAIRADGLGKRYRIGQRERYRALRDVVTDAVASLVRRLRQWETPGADLRPGGRGDYVWALRDVSFTVRHGEVLGIVGRNGAGKSTLLKLLSRITEPTEGVAELRGRVGSLLEVGTGFHPELTGRENIFLNGAILGMHRAEIVRKFDEIVAFAEVERFIDTPVKRYSDGMYMRLAFAVAASLEPEILLVDEVLAVGDAAFQQKCLGKMGEVAKTGRTVLFVSHNMTAVQSLCQKAIWIDQGRLVDEGSAAAIVSRYLQTSFSTATEQTWRDPATAPGNEQVRLRRACVRPREGLPTDPITVRTPFVMEFEYRNLLPGAQLSLSLHLYNEQGILVFDAGPVPGTLWEGQPLPAGLFRDVCHVPGDLLNDGTHRVDLLVIRDQGVSTVIHQEEEILVFDVRDDSSLRGDWYDKWPGAIRPLLDWRTELVEEETATLPWVCEASGP